MKRVEALATQLVQEAPRLEPAVIEEMRMELMSIGEQSSPSAIAGLALTIARIYEYTAEGLVDAAISLPALAEACATLVAGVEGRVDQKVLEAARYQIDTLEPMPDPPPRIAVPDVPLVSLKKR